jgi:hypothetical protein
MYKLQNEKHTKETSVGTIPKYNRKLIETEAKSIPGIHTNTY